ncbi:adenosylcobinamide-GDP ribazoletransferase [Marinitoga aeolica]|uniref:Adenosylcobinamide-GDP ribazoletransferase n=1 Tax=Marinitoga aeolica TaxID=2809031 RepID=A0ABY8PT17_9BACT|nr:adenosylcobinamide-GDP ribazoletransferase [Marinitoga aeolica]WGS65773.1 adenosylcobinamide-GDP ribazoletransferase [Marinitoga aeolica]
MKGIILMFNFFTRIPIYTEYNEKDFSKGMYFLPLIGLIIGFLMYIFSYIPVEKTIYVLFSWILYIWITGGLHLDGVADSFDGIFSNRNKEEILRIMKDSRIGTFGVVGLIVLILTNLIFSYYINYVYILIMPVIGRSSALLSASVSTYARNNGMGYVFITHSNIRKFFISFLIVLPILVLFNIFILLPIIITYIFVIFLTKKISEKIGGMTGDTIGLIIELSQTIFLITIYILRGML